MKKRFRNILLTTLVLALVSTQTLVRAEESMQPQVDLVNKETLTETIDNDKTQESETPKQKTVQVAAAAANSNIQSGLSFGQSEKDSYQGGDTFSVYTDLIISSTESNVIPENSTLKINVPKQYINELKASDVLVKAEYYKDASVQLVGNNYVITIKSKSLAGGTDVSIPIKLTMKDNAPANNKTFTISQTWTTPDGKEIAANELKVKMSATMEKPYFSIIERDMTDIVVDGIIPENTSDFFLSEGMTGVSGSVTNDSRDRRVYATIPAGAKIVDDGLGSWSFDGTKYYRDLTRENLHKSVHDGEKFIYPGSGIKLDISGINLKNTSQAEPHVITVPLEIKIVENGVVQTDLTTNNYSGQNKYFIRTVEENNKWLGDTQVWVNFVDENYNYVSSRPEHFTDKTSATAILKYSELNDNKLRLRMTHKNASGLKNEGDPNVGPSKATIETSTLDVPSFMNVEEFRIGFIGSVEESDKAILNSKINGTKVYGVKGTDRVLLGTINTGTSGSSVESTFNGSEWVKAGQKGDFTKVLFEYPNGGISFTKDEGSIDLLDKVHSEVIFTPSEKSFEELKEKFNTNSALPKSEFESNVQVIASIEGNTGIKSTFQTTKKAKVLINLEYAQVGRNDVLRSLEGNTFFPGDEFTLMMRSYASILGDASYSARAENPNVYYLLPEGFEVTGDNSQFFESIKTLKNFKNGQTLVIAKPVKVFDVKGKPGFYSDSATHEYQLKIKVSERVKEKTYEFDAAYMQDNNKLKTVNGKQVGFVTENHFWNNSWLDIIQDGDNRLDAPKSIVNFGKINVTIKPARVFSSYNEVKNPDKSGSQFASSTGRDATRGSKVDYRWNLVNDSSSAINSMTLINVLPYPGDVSIVANSDGSHTPRGSQFKTPLTQAISSDTFDIYYSVDEPLKDVKNEPSVNWVSSVSDYSKVTMIKAVLKSGKTVGVNQTVQLFTNNVIPNNPNIKDNDIAFNNFALTLNEGTTYMDAPGAEARVYLERDDVVIEKVDEFNKNLKLEGAQFSVYDSRDRLVLSNLVTNSNGNVTLPNLAVGESYYLVETKAPAGYIAQEGKIPFTVKSGTNTLQVINSKNEKTSVTVTKEWVGGPDVHPTISVQLFQNGNKLGAPVELENGTNSYTWSGLNAKDPSGNKYIYTVDEVSQLPNYEKEINGTHIINKFVENKTINISGTKTWEDASNKEGLRPGSIKVRLHANGTELNLEPTWVKNGDTWTYTFENVPEKENGTVIQYTITEDEVANYTSNVTGKNITNSRTVSKRNVTGTKTWVDNNDSDGLRPETVEITLFADGTKVEATPTWKTDSKNVWSYTYSNLDKYANGKEIEYTVEETKVDGYDKLIVGLDITNTHKADTKTVSGTKVWDDNKNQDGIRPDEVSIILYANGQEVKASPIWTNTNKDTWNFTYPSLPKFANGEEITYTVDEKVVPEGYTKDVQEFTITNSHTPSKIDVTGTKTWDDNKNQDGIRPEEIKITLYANGEKVTAEPTWVKGEHSWSYTFAGQPEFKGGQLITYTVTEEEVPGYTTKITGRDIINSHKADTRSVTGVKTWDDASNIAGFRPEEITVKLHANGTELNLKPTWTKAENTWTYTFENLPEKENGVDIEYTVTEEAVEHYTTDIQGLNITNSHTPSKIDVTGTKTWDDNKNQDGIRPEEIKITLYANGEKVTAEPTWVKGEHSWSYTFAGQPEYKGGQLITYTVTEDTVPGYTPKITGLDITNSHKADTRSVTGVKTWDDASNIAGFRPEEITVKLHANGAELNLKPTWTKAENTWTYTFENLPEKENGVDIEYTVTEEAVEHYTTDIQGLNITNSHTPSKIDVTGTKTWDDNKNQDGIRPEEIKITLYANGEEVTAEPTWIKGEHSWSYTFANQPEYKGGQLITYTVTEDTVPGYTPEITGLDITNSHKADTRSVTGVKTWDDASNIAGFRPEEIEITLYANGEKVNAEPSWTKAENTWTYEFANLEVKENGVDIEYTVTEEAVEHYTTDIQGLNITNSHTPSKIDVIGTKTWDDNKNQDGIRPEEIKITLYANGEEVTAEPTWVKGEHSWSYTFAGQPEFKGGQLITYTVTEDTVPGYTPKITGLDITNSHKADTKVVTGIKTWDDASNIAGFRPAEIEITLYANGEKVNAEPTWTKAENTWTYEFANLEVKENGVDIEYTVTEEAVEHYTTDIQGLNITNSHTPSKIDVTGTKTWDDNKNQDGIRPEEIKITLHANGEEVTAEPTWVKGEHSWIYTFAGQPEYKGGQLITYTVTEDTVPGYTPKITGLDITNTHKADTKVVTGVKTWDDASNIAGFRPEEIKITLYANGEKVNAEPTWTKAENTWTYEFANLDVKENGVDIEYTVTEEAVEHYTTDIQGLNITNSHTPSKINVEGTKTWKDSSDQDGKRPETIVVTLYANGEKVDTDAVWSQTDEDVWNYVFADQPEYKGGELIEYTVKEDDVVGYTTKIEGLNITNSRATEVRTITGTKVWNDNDNQDGIRPENIVVKLIANGKKLEVKPEWIKNGNTWSYKFANLPKYANKEIINYVIEELGVDGYTAKITDYNLVNTHEVSLINIEGTKTWDDHKNQDGIRPEAVEVALYANGEKVDVKPVWTQTEGDVWHYVFENQPEFKAGEKITYTVDETEVAGYVKGIEGYSITNTHKPSVVEIKGQKEWVDESNQDGLRPEAITVTLFKNGEAQDVKAQWTKAENTWSYTFGELPEYENGEKLVYTITEEAVAGYSSVVNGLNLVNTHEVSLIDLEGQKIWDDNSNKENKRPESITVNLYANGEKVDVKPEWTKGNDTWNYTFKSLPEFKAGAKIIYTVDEEAVANYESAIDGFTITNTVKETVDPEKPNPEKPKPTLPGTGVASDGTLVLAGLASIIGGLKLRSKSRKKEEEEA
ncbi:Cna B-type domain-containing protein [Erysipelothrix inopinata]